MNRRHFLKRSAIATGLIYVPRTFAQAFTPNDPAFVQPARPPGNTSITGVPILSAFTNANALNNFTGKLGFLFTCDANFTSTYLQRWVLAGNSQNHLITIESPAGTVLASATVSTTGVAAESWASVPCVFSFVSGNVYFIQSAETSGGDSLYQGSGGVGCSATLDAAVGVSLEACANGSPVSTGKVYVPLNMLH